LNEIDLENILSWKENKIPVSVKFDDPYYSMQDGLEETVYVFLQGNKLSERLIQNNVFHVAELGFGTGLNFLATLKLFYEIAPANAKLFFSSFELYPLSKEDMHKALSHWPDLADYAALLLEKWPIDLQQKDIHIELDRVSLRIYLGDANIRIEDLSSPVDAWYLDGFSPAKNPELWTQDLLNKVYEKANSEGSFATYSAAGWVRERLSKAGFNVERVKGFAHKKHMTIGQK